ncbi:MAG: lysylphosphatidylglycerol synthase domain-containing protein [Cyanobacteria bacterium P01_A01_bin.135]
MRNSSLLRLLRLLPPCLGLAIFTLCGWAIYQELSRYSLQEILRSVQAISVFGLVGAIALVGVSYLTLTGYDTVAARFARCPLPYRRTALVALLTYAISRSAGFSVVSGSAIRYRFYRRWGVSNLAIAQIIAFCSLSFWVGLFGVGGALFWLAPPDLPANLYLFEPMMQRVGLIGLVVTALYLGWSGLSHRSLRLGSWTVPRLPLPLAVAQLGLTLLDWGLAAGILAMLLSGGSFEGLSYLNVLSVYLLAQVVGVLSSVPGGLGVFETVVLATLSPPLGADRLLAALLVYRLIYFLLPLVTAIALLVAYELRVRKPNAGEMEPPPEIGYGD